MIPSNVHENTIQALAVPFKSAMSTQRTQNPEFGVYWALHNNKGAAYEEALDGSRNFQPDLGIYNNNDALLLTEVVYKQPWDNILNKVEHMVQGEECWGVLVVMITERDKWGAPTRSIKETDFVTPAEWLSEAKASRNDEPYGPVCIKGIDWTKAVDVGVYFFGHAWVMGDGIPTEVHRLLESYLNLFLRSAVA
jgi:hypothetical protein